MSARCASEPTPARGFMLVTSSLVVLSELSLGRASAHTPNLGEESLGVTSSRTMTILSKQNLPKAVEDMLSFADCPSLLRASRIGRVMRRGAVIFKNSTGSAHTYELSDITKSIDAFISHNWITSRWKKYSILALHFNCRTATLSHGAVMVVLVILGRCDVLPSTVFGVILYNRGLLARVLSIPTFLLVLMFMRDVCPSRWSPTVFLDKTCVHQTDEAKKMQGIRKLGAFLMHSETMVVCHNSLYFSKLGPVYELASFLSTSPASRIKFIPTHVPVFFISALLVAYVVDMLTWALQIAGSKVAVPFFTYPLLLLAAICMMRKAGRERAQIIRSLETFCVRDAMCYQEEDRKVVNFNIAQMRRACFGLSQDASESEALDNCDQLVRTELPHVVEGCCGNFAFPYKYWVLGGYLLFCPWSVDAVCGFAHGIPLRYFVAQNFSHLFFYIFVYIPLVVGIGLDWLSSAHVGLRGAWQVLWMFCVFVMALVSMSIAYLVFKVMNDISSASDAVLTVYLLVDLFLAAATYCLASRHHRCFSAKAKPNDGSHGLSLAASVAQVRGAGDLIFGSATDPVDCLQLPHASGPMQPEADGAPVLLEQPWSSSACLREQDVVIGVGIHELAC